MKGALLFLHCRVEEGVYTCEERIHTNGTREKREEGVEEMRKG
jgi:hypothetical protein